MNKFKIFENEKGEVFAKRKTLFGWKNVMSGDGMFVWVIKEKTYDDMIKTLKYKYGKKEQVQTERELGFITIP